MRYVRSLPGRKKCLTCKKFIKERVEPAIGYTTKNNSGKLEEKMLHCSDYCINKLSEKSMEIFLNTRWTVTKLQNMVDFIQEQED